MYELSQHFFFDAAHTLDRQVEREGSLRIHGHTYQAQVSVGGLPDPNTGMVVDLGHLRIATEKVKRLLDHQFLDKVPGLNVPTLENLCGFIAKHMALQGYKLSQVRVWRDGIGDACQLSLNTGSQGS
jgi:6-pyruvoyltetrahydropterin/6-carboxytetrahydropterin synthase